MLAATILGSSMVFIDSMAVNAVLPVIQEDLAASVSQMQWVIGAFTLSLAALLLVGGSLGDRMGRLRAFVWGVALFALTSLAASLASTSGQLITARAAQGAAAALLVPASLATIAASFDEGQRVRAYGIWASVTAFATALGPLLGGLLTDLISWRAIFLLNLPVAAAVLAIVFTFSAHSREKTLRGPTDWAGAALGTFALGGIAFGLIESGDLGLTHPLVLTAFAIGLAALAGFVWAERRNPAPMAPLGLFGSASFTGANVLTLLLYGALAGSLFFLPFNLIQVQGYSATAAGAAWLPFVVLCGALSPWANGLARRYGPKRPLVAGPAIAAVGFGLFAIPGVGGSYWTTFFPAFVVLGIGFGVTVAPLVTVVMESVDETHTGVASGINNAVARGAALLAIAAVGILVLSSFDHSLDERLSTAGVPAEVVAAIEEGNARLAAIEPPPGLDEALREQIDRAIDGAFVASFRAAAVLGSALALGGSLSALLLIGGGAGLARQPRTGVVKPVPASSRLGPEPVAGREGMRRIGGQHAWPQAHDGKGG